MAQLGYILITASDDLPRRVRRPRRNGYLDRPRVMLELVVVVAWDSPDARIGAG